MKQTPTRTRQARQLRGDMTSAEAVLWRHLSARRFEGLKFRRQAPVAGYIADFACHEVRLAVELDGGIHAIRAAEDAARDAKMAAEGYVVLRSSNEAFRSNPNLLLDTIRAHVASASDADTPSSDPLRGPPSPLKGEGKVSPSGP